MQGIRVHLPREEAVLQSGVGDSRQVDGEHHEGELLLVGIVVR